jgi:hypothetical protein
MESLPSGIAADPKRPLRSRIVVATAMAVVAIHVALPHLLPSGLAGWPLIAMRTAVFAAGTCVILALSRGLPWVLCVALLILLPVALRPLAGVLPGVRALVFAGGPLLCVAAAGLALVFLLRRQRLRGGR